MFGSELTIAVALAAGVVSFLSPCVLPLVPAYLGQLTAVAVAGKAAGTPASRWIAVRHAIAYVMGFGAVFTLLGITATYAASGLSPYLSQLRQIGGGRVMPTTLFIGPDGSTRHKKLGGYANASELEADIRRFALGAS